MQNQSYEQTYREHQEQVAADADETSRMAFIKRTYAHLVGAIFAFVGIEVVLFQMGIDEMLIPYMLGSQYSWLIVLGVFMGVGMLADWWARSGKTPPMQYAGLGLYILAEAVIFLPILHIAMSMSDPTLLPTAAVLTLIVFGGLTAFVFISKQDFSFLRIAVVVGMLLAMGGIVVGTMFGVNLGMWFSVFMVGLSAIYILYTTSNVLHHYRTDQHVAASLALFSAIALLFWYILRILMAFSGD